MTAVVPALVKILPWVMSATTMLDAYLCGCKWRYVWLFSFWNSVLWSSWTIMAGQWGLMPVNIFFLAISLINHRKWNPKPKKTR